MTTVRFAFCLTLLAWGILGTRAVAAKPADRPLSSRAASIFERRILPIFNSPNPSSCTECHLAGVDLKNYILPSHEMTFLSLRDQGLIDMNAPEHSKILKFIAMAAKNRYDGDGKPERAALIPDRVRQAEYEAFAEWVKASVRDPRLKRAPRLDPQALARPVRPVEVIRHDRMDRVFASFLANVWTQRMRCSNCHAAQGGQNAKLVEENGDEVTWIRPEGPEATMRYLMASGNIDVGDPLRSKLLRKPTNQMKHGGGKKMAVGDTDYVGFRTWIEDYAKVANNAYAGAAELPPAPARVGTDIWLRVARAPADWKGKFVRMAVHAWDADENRWEHEPTAVATCAVDADAKPHKELGIFAHMTLSLRADAQSSLPPGKYRLRVYLGSPDRVRDDLKAVEEGDLFGETEFTADWKAGYAAAVQLDAKLLRMDAQKVPAAAALGGG